MKEDFFPPRLDRTRRLLGEQKLKKLQDSFVLIVGLGAVGGYALEGIVRAGVNRIRIVDFDRFSETNINRQLLATTKTLGHQKTDVAKQRILDINPHCQIESYPLFFDETSADEILGTDLGKNRPDLVIDAIDSVSAKGELLIQCLKRGIPVFSSMGAALRTKTEYIKTGDLMKSHGCALAKKMRLTLRKAGLNKGVTCVYSHETIQVKSFTPQLPEKLPPENKNSRQPLGSLPTITAIFGMTLANLAIEKLTQEIIHEP